MIIGNWGRWFIWLLVYNIEPGKTQAGTQGRNLQSGTEAESTEKHYVLAWAQSRVHLPFLHRQASLPRNGTTYSRPDSLTSTVSNKYPICMSTTEEAIPHLRFPPSRCDNHSLPSQTWINYQDHIRLLPEELNYSTGRNEKDWLVNLWPLRSKGIVSLSFFFLHSKIMFTTKYNPQA